MAIASIHLSDQETQALHDLAQQTGKTQDELLHEAVTRLLTDVQQHNRQTLLRQARGIWKDRAELPDPRTLRSEFDRFTS
jgi:predicted transcriptional regulator